MVCFCSFMSFCFVFYLFCLLFFVVALWEEGSLSIFHLQLLESAVKIIFLPKFSDIFVKITISPPPPPDYRSNSNLLPQSRRPQIGHLKKMQKCLVLSLSDSNFCRLMQHWWRWDHIRWLAGASSTSAHRMMMCTASNTSSSSTENVISGFSVVGFQCVDTAGDLVS